MNIFQLLRNPLVKIIGAGVILYFALFHDKNNPESLGNRLDPQRVKSELNEVREKGSFIISNVNLAKQVAEENKKKKEAEAAKNSKVSIVDIDAGSDDDKTTCGDITEINYAIYLDNEDGKELVSKEKTKLILGNRENETIENNILGLGRAGVRDIKVPHDFKTNNPELKVLLETHRTNLRYRITILSFLHNPDTKLSCK